MLSQIESRFRKTEKENVELIRQNADLVDTVRRLSAIIDEQYILLSQYASLDAADGFEPLFQSMFDVAQKAKEQTEGEDAN